MRPFLRSRPGSTAVELARHLRWEPFGTAVSPLCLDDQEGGKKANDSDESYEGLRILKRLGDHGLRQQGQHATGSEGEITASL